MFKTNFLSFFAIYAIISSIIFYYVYRNSINVVDEYFHIPQATEYCRGNFSHWDNKITTLPGLYIYSTILLLPFQACTPLFLRMTNLLASWINVILTYKIVTLLNKTTPKWLAILVTANISLFPPLYFFANLYYTDVLALTPILLMIYYAKQNRHGLGAIFGALAILVRQTNVIWVAVVFGETFLNLIMCKQSSVKSSARSSEMYTFQDLTTVGLQQIFRFQDHGIAYDLHVLSFIPTFPYVLTMLTFVAFVMVNGSVVVGDKSAHQAQLHVPQLFYFALFHAIFSWPRVMKNLKPLVTWVKNHTILTVVILSLMIWAVNSNTLVHEYLLADNRHFTFYIWRRFYGKFAWARYAIIPVYFVGLFTMVKTHCSATFMLPFLVGLALVLGVQKMIDVRYFIAPFVFLRLRTVCLTRDKFELLLEFLTFAAVNAWTFWVFFNTRVTWQEYGCVQGVMW